MAEATKGTTGADAALARLEADRAALAEQVRSLAAQFDGFVEATDLVATDDEHDPEGHTIAFERQQVAALLRDGRAKLASIDAALERLAGGSYGSCTRCGAAIGAERLEAVPGAEHCIGCAV
jgi:RNA polymerase-binding transcription factor DksA